MKRALAIIMMFGLLLTPFAVYPQSEQTATKALPVGQALVPEGDFALKFVAALKLGTATTEGQAEDMLTSVGIAPKNGWIADYPMTPIIIGELQSAVVAAAAGEELPMGKDEALKAFQDLTTEFGLAVVPGSGQYAEGQPSTSSEYVQPTVVNNYYYDEGPPVVTYYPPPSDYDYLYAWVSYPFWCSGSFFPGFFVLSDFDIIVVGHHHHHHVITNHFIDPKTNKVLRVDPTTKTMGRTVNAPLSRTQGFNSPGTRKGAVSIFNRSLEKVKSANAMTTTGKGAEGNVSRGMAGQPGNIGQQNEANVQRPSTGEGRTFSTPSGRGFNGASEDSGRSFSPPSRSFSGPSTGGRSSFSGFHSGGFSGGIRR
jgi:hypothetical protein